MRKVIADLPDAVRPIVEAACRAVKAVAPKAEEIPCAGKQPRSASMMWKLVRYAVVLADEARQALVVDLHPSSSSKASWISWRTRLFLSPGASRSWSACASLPACDVVPTLRPARAGAVSHPRDGAASAHRLASR